MIVDWGHILRLSEPIFMIKITKLTLKNFLSVGAVTSALSLDQNGLTLILGSNTDSNGGLTRNGAGKTTILQAISYALYGSPISKIKADNLINNINQKGMLVTIEFERDGKTYRIERGRKPNILKFFVNSEEVETDPEDISQGENRHTQEMINQAIGMSSTMFKHIVALNTYTDPFLRMKAGDQREVIEELLGVTQISLRAETLKKLVSQTKEGIRDQDSSIRAIKEANSRIQAAIDNALRLSEDWVAKHARRLAGLGEEIAAMESINYDAEIAAFDAVDAWLAEERKVREGLDVAIREVQHYQRDLGVVLDGIARAEQDYKGTNPQISRSETEIDRKRKEITRKQAHVEKHETAHAKVVADLENPDTKICVCCNQKLEGTEHLEQVLNSLREQESSLAGDIVRYRREIVELETEIAAIVVEVATLQAADEQRKADAATRLSELVAEKEDKLKLVEEHAVVQAEWSSKKSAIGPKPETIFSSRDEVYKTKSAFDGLMREYENEKGQTNPNLTQVETLKATLQTVDTTVMDELSDLMKHQEFLLKLLTSKDSFIRKKIIDQNLAYLNSRLNHYLDKLGLPHEVRFQSDLSVDITLLGRDFDFEQLSRGEMNRVIMATSWSFRDVWESLNDSFNLLFVDEMLDQGTDGHGVEAALTILKSMARERSKNVFLISHRDDLTARIDRTLLVRKENGFTRFEEDALV